MQKEIDLKSSDCVWWKFEKERIMVRSSMPVGIGTQLFGVEPIAAYFRDGVRICAQWKLPSTWSIKLPKKGQVK